MRYAEKLYKQMLLKGLNQQRLARLSEVSDSEISRILAGKSKPGLENAFKLAKVLGISLDYLADEAMDVDPAQGAASVSAEERDIQELVGELGPRSARRLLETARELGFEVAIRRLLNLEKPTIEVGEAPRAAAAHQTNPQTVSQRASSA